MLDDIARARGWPTSLDAARLGARVRKLSDAYNDGARAPVRSDELLSARLLFSFPRDVPKGAGAVRELCAAGALAFRDGRPLRVLDVGAGLGATVRGVARALAASGASGEVHVDALDSDGEALDLAKAIAHARPREAGVHVQLSPMKKAVAAASVSGPYDLIVLGQVLSELDREHVTSAAERVARHAALLRAYSRELHENGALVVAEPALRERTRHLHAVRDALLAEESGGLRVFAPCVHDDPCPALRDGEAWCHEDLDVDLPPWLVPVARTAGLRWQGLTFSYLVLRKDGLRACAAGAAPLLRVVSGPVVTKGKREIFLCGRFDDGSPASRLKVMRLDRHRSPENRFWDVAARGDVVRARPAVAAARPRVGDETTVECVTRGRGEVDSPEGRR